MADALTRRDGRPVNIRKVNNQWVFDKALFGSMAKTLPSALLVVPQDMIPSLVYMDNSTGYIPENDIVSYLSSQRFANALKQAQPTAVAAAPGGIGVRGGDPRATTKIPQTAVVKSVQNTIKNLNVQQRTNAFASMKTKTDTKSNQQVTSKIQGEAFAGTFPGTSSGPWDFTKRVVNASLMDQALGNVKYGINPDTGQLNQDAKPVLLLPDDKGNLTSPFDEVRYNELFWTMGSDQVKKWQKFFGAPQTGNMTQELASAMLGTAHRVSLLNYNLAARGETTAKPYGLWDGANFLKKSGDIDTTGSGAAPKKTRDVNITQFTPQEAKASINKVFLETVGREASWTEIKKLTKEMNQKLKQNPEIVSYAYSGANVTSTRSGGFDAAAWLTTKAEQLPQYQEFRDDQIYSRMANLMRTGG